MKVFQGFFICLIFILSSCRDNPRENQILTLTLSSNTPDIPGATFTPQPTLTTIPGDSEHTQQPIHTATPTGTHFGIQKICEDAVDSTNGLLMGTAEYLDQRYIFLVNSDGSGFRWLTPGNLPTWSPQGDYIIYQPDFLSPESSQVALYGIKPDGTGQVQLTFDDFTVLDYPYAWSNDGQKMYFAGHRSGDEFSSIYSVDLDDLTVREVIGRISGNLAFPEMMPDGETLIFSIIPKNMVFNFFGQVKIDGSGFEILSMTEDMVPYYQGGRDLSPSGKELLFVGSLQSQAMELYLLSLEDGSLKIMVEGNINPFDGRSINFSWSPNGEMVAYTISEDKNNKLYVMNSDGSSVKLVLDDGDLLFSWYPDSRHLGIIKRELGQKDQLLEIDICNLETSTLLEGDKLTLLLWQPK